MTSVGRQRFDICCHITYIVECIATDLTGEAKFQLDSITKVLERSDLHDKQEILSKLTKALELYDLGDNHQAAVCATSASRQLYKGLTWPENR